MPMAPCFLSVVQKWFTVLRKAVYFVTLLRGKSGQRGKKWPRELATKLFRFYFVAKLGLFFHFNFVTKLGLGAKVVYFVTKNIHFPFLTSSLYLRQRFRASCSG